MSLKAKYLIVLAVAACALFAVPQPLSAASLNSGSFQLKELKRIKADSWDVVGKNIVVKGNVYIPFGDLEIFADQAVINADGKDIEATGSIRFYRWQSATGSVNPGELAVLERRPNTKVEVLGINGNIWGDQKISVKASSLTDNIRATRLVGNLESGYFSFENAQLKFKTFVCRAKFGERKADGVIRVRDAEVSACDYLEHDNAHYSISCTEATLTPHKTQFYGLENIDTDPGDHTVFMTNGFWRIYGVPVLWLPVFYKPKDESPGLFSIHAGESSDWGYFVNLSKRFTFLDYPYSSVKVMGDYYSKRGWGYGADAELVTEQSQTDIFAYALWDFDSNATDDYDKYRIRVPKYRYDFRIANVTHLTPRLDFRGVFEYSSDPYFVRDFFESRYNADPEPASYAALEQQFDHLSAVLYIRPKVNSFYSTVERLPGFALEAQRQEIFDTNFYYQGNFSTDYLKMDWVKFDTPLKNQRADQELRNYDSFRLDTTHFLYYPIRLDWLTVVPRAGFKVTAYSDSSKTAVDEANVLAQFNAANLENMSTPPFVNYDNKGGGKVRFAGEFGVEASTKIYNSWQNVKNAWLMLDGLRHVFRPYINYTYLPEPTEKRDHLYYFDDIDRITKQHFIRFGMDNRLQTRSGNSVRDVLYMENYWDLYFDKESGYNNIGNFCTILAASPFKGLTLSTEFAIDMGGNNDELEEVDRNGRPGGHPGLNIDWLNRWNLQLSYQPIEDVTLTFAYDYKRPYGTRSAYSMGSTLTQIDAGRIFDKYYTEYSQELTFGIQLPLTPDKRTWGSYSITYDLYMGYVDSQSFKILRKFHCFDVAFECMLERDDGEWMNYDKAFMFSIYLNNLQGPLQGGQNSMLQTANRMGGAAGSNMWSN